MVNAERKQQISIRGVQSDDELKLANDLMAKGHQVNYFSASEWFEGAGAAYPGYRPEHTRIALCDGELAGALRLTTETIRLGEARLKMGGLGWVTTAPRHRHKGVGTALIRDAFAYMRAHRYHVSMLFGIPNFYHRFGYATVLPDYAIEIDVSPDRPEISATRRVRDVKPGDIGALRRVHEANDADVPCSLLRSSGTFSNKWDLLKVGRVLTDASGKVLGYALGRPRETGMEISELGALLGEDQPELLSMCSAWAHEMCRGTLRFLTPPGHPFSHYLESFASRHETRRAEGQGGMMAFVDVGETLETAIPEWEERLRRSALGSERAEVTLQVDKIPYRVRATRGAIDVSPIAGTNKVGFSGRDLMRVFTGYIRTEDLLAQERRNITAAARHLLATLFPKRDPYVWPLDRF
ncbi:MAG: GNAT family N-acetyltransferase [Candidatus Hydrogenedentota bacterium]